MTERRLARRPLVAVAVGLVLVLALAACGSSSLSDTQLRTSAGGICTAADRVTDQIPAPARPSDGAAYLKRGLAALAPEMTKLRALRAPSDLAAEYAVAVDAGGGEVAAVRSAIKGLKAGGDPVVEIKTLQRHLAPLEKRADGAWRSVDVDACVSR